MMDGKQLEQLTLKLMKEQGVNFDSGAQYSVKCQFGQLENIVRGAIQGMKEHITHELQASFEHDRYNGRHDGTQPLICLESAKRAVEFYLSPPASKDAVSFQVFLDKLNYYADRFNASNYCDTYNELSDDEKAEIKAIYESVNAFEAISLSDLDQQAEDYDDAYMGENVKVGDILWFDGEVFCNRDTVERWLMDSEAESEGKYLDWKQCAEIAKEALVLDEFDRLQAN